VPVLQQCALQLRVEYAGGLTVDPRLDLGCDRVGHARDPPPLAAPHVQAVADLRGPARPRQRARDERASGGWRRVSLGRPLLGMDRGRRETTSKWAGFEGDAFSPLPLPMIAGEVNSCLFSPKMGMREDLPALLKIALGTVYHCRSSCCMFLFF
jgi:hypothetical protein